MLVGAKYGNVEVVKLLLKDERVDVGLVDDLGRFTTPPLPSPSSIPGQCKGWLALPTLTAPTRPSLRSLSW